MQDSNQYKSYTQEQQIIGGSMTGSAPASPFAFSSKQAFAVVYVLASAGLWPETWRHKYRYTFREWLNRKKGEASAPTGNAKKLIDNFQTLNAEHAQKQAVLKTNDGDDDTTPRQGCCCFPSFQFSNQYLLLFTKIIVTRFVGIVIMQCEYKQAPRGRPRCRPIPALPPTATSIRLLCRNVCGIVSA